MLSAPDRPCCWGKSPQKAETLVRLRPGNLAYYKSGFLCSLCYINIKCSDPVLLIPGGEEGFSSLCIGRVLEIPLVESAVVRL